MIALSGHLIPCGVEFSFLLPAVFCGFFAMFLPFHYCAQAHSNPKALLQRFILTHCQNRYVIGQYSVRRNGNIRFSCTLDAEDIDAELSANIQFSNAFPDPRLWHLNFKDGVLLVDLYIVKNMVGSESNRGPFCHLHFGIDHVICAVAEQKLRLHVAFGAGIPRILRPALSAVEVVSSEFWKLPLMVTKQRQISDTERTQKLRTGAVADLRVGDNGSTSLIRSSLVSTAMT